MPATSYPPTDEQRSCIVRFLLTPSEDEELRRLAKQRGVAMSEVIRRALFDQNGDQRRRARRPDDNGSDGFHTHWARGQQVGGVLPKAILMVLVSHADNKTGLLKIRRKTLAEEVNCSLSHLDRGLTQLRELGLVSWEARNGGGGRRSSLFRVHFDASPVLAGGYTPSSRAGRGGPHGRALPSPRGRVGIGTTPKELPLRTPPSELPPAKKRENGNRQNPYLRFAGAESGQKPPREGSASDSSRSDFSSANGNPGNSLDSFKGAKIVSSPFFPPGVSLDSLSLSLDWAREIVGDARSFDFTDEPMADDDGDLMEQAKRLIAYAAECWQCGDLSPNVRMLKHQVHNAVSESRRVT
jgi:hypothetical protein